MTTTTSTRTEDMSNLERAEWMLERCEEAASNDASLFNPVRGYLMSEIDWVRYNMELFRRGGKMDYYWTVDTLHKNIVGEPLPTERIIVHPGSDLA